MAVMSEAHTVRGGDDWMVLRNENPRYSIPQTREEWLASLVLDGVKDGQDVYLLDRVESCAKLIEQEGITTFYSVGSGGAAFEYYLKKRLPELKLIVTECTAEGVERLRTVFTEADGAELFDALSAADWKKVATLPNVLVFMYRNEREFTDTEWRTMFRYMYEANVPRILLGLMWTLTCMSLYNRILRNTRARLAGVPIAFAGYIRNRKALARLWEGQYHVLKQIPFPTCTGLYLERLP